MVYISTAIMGVGCLVFSFCMTPIFNSFDMQLKIYIVSFHPSLMSTFIIGSVLGGGYGCYTVHITFYLFPTYYEDLTMFIGCRLGFSN